MSNTITLTANKRDLLGKGNARRLRRAGQIPVNVYAKGEESKSLMISEADAKLAHYHNGLVTLNIEGLGPQSAVMKEIQIHPISNKILHIDFHAVKADEMIKSVVPIVLEGDARAANLSRSCTKLKSNPCRRTFRKSSRLTSAVWN